MKKIIGLLFAVAFLNLNSPLRAHDITDRSVQDIGVSVELKIAPEKLIIDYWIHIGDIEALPYRHLIDKDKNQQITAEEKNSFLGPLKEYLQTKGFNIIIDGQAYPSSQIRCLNAVLDLKNEEKPLPVPVKIDFEFELPLDKTESGEPDSNENILQGKHRLSFYACNTLNRSVLFKIFAVSEHGIQLAYTPQGEIDVKLMREGRRCESAGYQGVSLSYLVSPEASPDFQLNSSSSDNTVKDKLLGYLRSEKLPAWLILTALALAFLWGAGHALQPGHGKTLVAAYLVGTHGTIRHAVFLGIIVTISHIFSVLVMGLVFLTAAEFIQAEQLSFYLQVGSGILVTFIGLGLLIQRLQHIREHLLGAEHPHHHHHASDGGAVRLKDIFMLGGSGGMVPCPTAVVILLMAISIKRIVWGLVLIAAFSLGLAAVLVIIGILMVSAKSFLNRFSGGGQLFRILSVVSAAIIVLIGSGIILQSYKII